MDFDSGDQKKSIELRRQVLRLPLGLDFTEKELQEEVDQYHFGGFLEDILCAVLLLKKDGSNSDVLKMRQVAVHPDHQGKGYGKQLVRFSEIWCLENGFKRIELHARSSAVEFYVSMNYSIVPGEFTEVGIPHLKMFKQF